MPAFLNPAMPSPRHRCRALPRIERVTVHRLQARLRGVFRIAYAAAATVESIVVEVVLSDGTRGWGEAAPAPRVTHENTASVEAYIEAVAEKLTGLEFPDGLGEALRRVHAGAPSFSSARAALESALLDAMARVLDTPVYTLLGGRVHRGLETDYTVSIPSPETLEEIRRGGGSHRDAFIDAVEYLVGLRSRAPEEPGFPLPAVQGFRVLNARLSGLKSLPFKEEVFPEAQGLQPEGHHPPGQHGLRLPQLQGLRAGDYEFNPFHVVVSLKNTFPVSHVVNLIQKNILRVEVVKEVIRDENQDLFSLGFLLV